MPVNNPGFDIRVSRPNGDLHVEVKGTVLPDAEFHLSEGQRLRAKKLGSDFRLIVVYDIRVVAGADKLTTVEGPLTGDKVSLATAAWRGQVVSLSGQTESVGQSADS